MPTFDENTHYVVEMAPEEGDDYIYIGLDVRELPMQETLEQEHDLFEIAPPGVANITLENRVSNVEKSQDAIVDVLAEIMGV